MASGNAIIIKDLDLILDQLESVSSTMVNYIKNHRSSRFTLYSKTINHSDLSNKGKRCGPNESVEKNYLYYQTNEEMLKLQAAGMKYETAKQSNMGIPSEIYDALNIAKEKGAVIPIKLVNDSAKYFNEDKTIEIMNLLGKECKWAGTSIYPISYGNFTDFTATYGDHGIGTSQDTFFVKLRLSIFLGDTTYFLVEKKGAKRILYLLLKKSDAFFKILSKKKEPDKTPSETSEISMVAEDDAFYTVTFSLKTKINGIRENGTLVGCYKNINHLKWILKNEKYNIRSGKRKGVIADNLNGVNLLVLYHMNNHDRYGVYEIKDHKEVSKQDMINMGYPSSNPGSKYIVFDIEEIKNIEGINIDGLIEIVKEQYADYVNGTPIIIK